jgi:hypothetical protein
MYPEWHNICLPYAGDYVVYDSAIIACQTLADAAQGWPLMCLTTVQACVQGSLTGLKRTSLNVEQPFYATNAADRQSSRCVVHMMTWFHTFTAINKLGPTELALLAHVWGGGHGCEF